MFSLYRRHEETCAHRDKGVRHTRCSCPIWMDGYDSHGHRQRRTLKTRDWRYAQQKLDRIESGPNEPAPAAIPKGPSLADAVQAYLADCRVRRLASGTVTGYETFLKHLTAFAPAHRVSAIDVQQLTSFRGGRAVTPGTQAKELGYLRAFFRFCLLRKWTPENHASALKLPKYDPLPTLPFDPAEVRELLAACDRIDNPNQREIARARLRAKALVLLLLYSGLRIGDAVKLERASLDLRTGRLLIRMMKTRAPLYVRLPPVVLEALAALPESAARYFFWSGTAKLSTAIGSARRTIACITKLAGVANGHPHRFRDTFAVGLLLAGEDLRTVQLLLGHTSLRTTEKHYAPYVEAMQQRLDDAVAKLHFDLPAEPRPDPVPDVRRNPQRNVRTLSLVKRA